MFLWFATRLQHQIEAKNDVRLLAFLIEVLFFLLYMFIMRDQPLSRGNIYLYRYLLDKNVE